MLSGAAERNAASGVAAGSRVRNCAETVCTNHFPSLNRCPSWRVHSVGSPMGLPAASLCRPMCPSVTVKGRTLGVIVAQTKEPAPNARRSAPYWEWVEMYRRGIGPTKIADVCGVAVTTVRYHLQIAATDDPGLRREHAAAMPAKVPTDTALQRMHDLISF